MSSTQNNNTNLAIATLNKFAIECIKIIEDLKQENDKKSELLIDLVDKCSSLKGELSEQTKKLSYQQNQNQTVITDSDFKVSSLKKDNKKLRDEIVVLKEQISKKSAPAKSAKINKNKEYYPAYLTSDFKESAKHNHSFINKDTDGESSYFDLLTMTDEGSCLKNNDLLLNKSFKAKKYLYDVLSLEESEQLLEQIFTTYTKKDLVNFIIETHGGWSPNYLVTCDKLITVDDNFKFNYNLDFNLDMGEDDYTQNDPFENFPYHLTTANY